MALSTPITTTAEKLRTGNFGDRMKKRIRFMTAITPANAHAYQVINLLYETYLPSQVRNFVCRLPRPDICISPMFALQHAKESMTSRDGPSTLTDVLALLLVKHLLDGVVYRAISPWNVWSSHHDRSSSGGARSRLLSNNTAGMSAMIEALSFRGLH